MTGNEQPIYELLEAVLYVSRHDDSVVLVREGKVFIARPVGELATAGY